MPKDVTLRPFCLWFDGLTLLPIIVSTDVELYKWLGLGIAAFSSRALASPCLPMSAVTPTYAA